tara:strand:- start:1552 stop:4941 length:3390 start_codon:yes stop_codon:yes gene_type:complete
MADNPIKYSDLVIDDGAIDQLIKKIQLLEKTFLASQKTFQKEIAKTKKATEDSTDATDNQEKELEKLEKQLEKLLKANEDLKTSEGEMNAQKKQALKLAKQEQTLKKKLIELTDDQALSNEELKLEIREQQKALKDQAKGNKGLTGEYEKQSKILNSLRKKYKDLAVAGKENSEEARKLLLSVTELDTKLKAVDKSVGQTQRSVGNYKDQVKEALEETGAFTESMVGAIDTSGALGGIMGKLGTIIELLRKAQDKLKDSVQAETVATEVQDKVTKKATFTQRLFSKATLGTAKAMKVLKAGLIASGIGIIVVLIGSLLATLTKTQAGLNGLDGAMRSFGAILEVVVGRLITFGQGLGNIFSVLVDKFNVLGLKFENFGLSIKKIFLEAKNLLGGVDDELGTIEGTIKSNDDEIKKLNKSISEDSTEATKQFTKTFQGLGLAIEDAVKKAMALAKVLNQIKLENAELSVELEKQLAISEKAEEIEGDATRSFEERTKAILTSIKAQKEASKISQQIAENNLKAVNEELKIAESQRQLTTDEKIQRLDAEREVLSARKEAQIKSLQLSKVRRQLEQDEIEKNLDILIDGFDNQKTINEQLIASDKLRFDERKKLLKETEELRKKILAEEISEINKVSKTQIDINDLIATSDSKLLNEKIRGYELSEILEGRLLEVVREARTQERDLDQASIDLEQEHFEIRKEIIEQLEDLKSENFISERDRELESIRLEEKRAIDSAKLEQKKFADTTTEYKKLDEIISEIEKKADQRRKDLNLDFFIQDQERNAKSEELKSLLAGETQKEINEKLTALKIEQLKKEIELRKSIGKDSIDQELELARLKAQKEVDIEKDKAEKIKDVQDKTAEAIFNSFQRNLDKQIDELDKLESKQLSIIDRQEQRAQEGLSNNLAFEESALAELEQKKIKAQKKQIALDKVQALYNAYSSASASGDKNAIITVLRDFSILQGIESAISSFGSGTGEHGDINDSLKAGQNGSRGGNSISNGVIRGESHAKRGFGVPILAEGNEGIWKGSTMDKFGKNNFIQLTKSIDNGSIGSNFMQPQVNALQVVQSSSGVDSALLQEMKETRKAIQNKPEQVVDVQRLSDNIIDFVDTRKANNKKVINRYRVKKKRI